MLRTLPAEIKIDLVNASPCCFHQLEILLREFGCGVTTKGDFWPWCGTLFCLGIQSAHCHLSKTGTPMKCGKMFSRFREHSLMQRTSLSATPPTVTTSKPLTVKLRVAAVRWSKS